MSLLEKQELYRSIDELKFKLVDIQNTLRSGKELDSTQKAFIKASGI